MPRIPFYFSIDFEDVSYDLSRSLGDPTPSWREEALKRSYERVQEISRNFFGGRKITFFVTGVLARKSLDLVKDVFEDGHESLAIIISMRTSM